MVLLLLVCIDGSDRVALLLILLETLVIEVVTPLVDEVPPSLGTAHFASTFLLSRMCSVSLITFSAADGSENVQNPKPLLLLVTGSLITTASFTEPY